jgi:hypothetical protein
VDSASSESGKKAGSGGPPSSDVVAFSSRVAPLTASDLNQIQGLIIRGYRKDMACHLVLRIDRPAAFRTTLCNLALEDLDTGPFITVASDWTDKPPVGKPATRCVNIGFTYAGLEAVGVNAESLKAFPQSFRAGAVKRARYVGDTGPNGPTRWRTSLGSDDPHVIISVYADTSTELDEVTDELGGRAGGAATVLDRIAAHRLGGSRAFRLRRRVVTAHDRWCAKSRNSGSVSARTGWGIRARPPNPKAETMGNPSGAGRTRPKRQLRRVPRDVAARAGVRAVPDDGIEAPRD